MRPYHRLEKADSPDGHLDAPCALMLARSSPHDCLTDNHTAPSALAGHLLTATLVEERGAPPTWRSAPTHPGWALAIIDAVMSPGIRTETVAAVFSRYGHVR